MDLLLDLIRNHEVDIFDIPIALITEEFLSYVDTLNELNLEVGGEWLEMAATLVYIKSRLLLPKKQTDDDEDGPDPREELVQRLLEYQKFKAAAEALDERPMLERDVFKHPARSDEWASRVGPPELREASITDLMSALQRVIKRSKNQGQWVYELDSQKLTLRSVIIDVAGILADRPRVTFDDLFEGHELTRNRIVTTFLALLEMTKLKMLKLFQARLDGDETLWVERAVVDIVDVSQELELSE
jgi:segregation and condensation protein A